MQGNDFEYQDPREPAFGDDIFFGTVQDGGALVDSARGTETLLVIMVFRPIILMGELTTLHLVTLTAI